MIHSKGYPYLAIAKHYGLNYETVLTMAHLDTHGNAATCLNFPDEDILKVNLQCLTDIKDAVRYYRDVQAGVESFPPT